MFLCRSHISCNLWILVPTCDPNPLGWGFQITSFLFSSLTFHGIPSKIALVHDPNSHGVEWLKHDFSVQICTFHTISSQKFLWYLTFYHLQISRKNTTNCVCVYKALSTFPKPSLYVQSPLYRDLMKHPHMYKTSKDFVQHLLYLLENRLKCPHVHDNLGAL